MEKRELMMSDIVLYGQEIIAQLCYDDGWKPAVGVKAEILDIGFSFVFKNVASPTLVVSELTSGSKVYECELGLIELLETITKEETYSYILKIALDVERIIESYGIESFRTTLQLRREKNEMLFGKMPEIRSALYE